MKRTFLLLGGLIKLIGAGVFSAQALDLNGNQQSDLWEMAYALMAQPGEADEDGDGFSNATESLFGTDPRSYFSRPDLSFVESELSLELLWNGIAGKHYTVWRSVTLQEDWSALAEIDAETAGTIQFDAGAPNGSRAFFRVTAAERDSDGDGLSDFEEHLIGFDPFSRHTQRLDTEDMTRVQTGLTAGNVITVSVYDDTSSERWPDPIVFTVRRAGGLAPLRVAIQLSGDAVRGEDYLTPGLAANVVELHPGQREAFINIVPFADALDEPPEIVKLTVLAGEGYLLGDSVEASGIILSENSAQELSPKEAARFLLQAAFGPSQDDPADPDVIPENVEVVQALGFEGWIEDQLSRPFGWLQPFTEWAAANANALELYGDIKNFSWWNRALGVQRLRPDAASAQASDELRQRVAFAFSQLFVISDRLEELAVEPVGMANFYDALLRHSFGNFRNMLEEVTWHPCMGLYLSHLGNRKPNPEAQIFPDENFAREVMQLFTIGLWELRPDGTRELDDYGQPIPTYSNADITEFARVFTGMSFGNNSNFGLWPRDFTVPMKAWDAEHDLAPKRLLRGQVTPARMASPGASGEATRADVSAALDNLFNHPNTGPFIARHLIQRLVTSNPSPAYVGRVAATFADNGQGVRGDLAAVVKTLLLDPEARSYEAQESPSFGKLREPFLRCVNLARAFDASAIDGYYQLDAFNLDHLQQPFNSPSVFNFYLPTYSPPGALSQLGLVAPEFQLLNDASLHASANYFWNAIPGGLHRWGVGRASREVRLNLDPERALILPSQAPNDPTPNATAQDPDPLLRRLDLVMTAGTLRAEQYQIIREALERVTYPQWDWPTQRLRLAIWLVASSPEFNILR